jgi:flagellar basal body-associated protein FliL
MEEKEEEKSKSGVNKSLIITVVVALAVGAIGFFGGMKYSQSRRGAAFRQFANGQGFTQRDGSGTNRNGFRPVSGEIIATDDNSITVKLPDGSSKIVIISDETQINKADTASKDDLTNGQTVAVFGQENSDGTVSAQNIQIGTGFLGRPQE